MNIKRYILQASIIFVAATAEGAGQDSTANVLASIVESHSGLWQVAEQSYLNPAVNQWRMSDGLTGVGVGYSNRNDYDNPDHRNGTGAHNLCIGADTYTKCRTSTLWGHAGYTNGKVEGVKWNETAHPELLYPYLLADSTGGDLSEEIYSFGGGYADCRGKLAWGAELSYDATLQYRNIDPRPRNIAGDLNASVGVMYDVFKGYFAGIGLNMRKYKQTNEIDFKSEMGVDKIYHLTGLGSHYYRFAGTGLSTYYDGRRWGGEINIYPKAGNGFFVSGRFTRFTFDKIITDLNKLPMASAWHNMFEAQGGWLQPGNKMYWGVSGLLTLYRRHGAENIFGDASSTIYPQIGSNEMFADNAVDVSVTGRWGATDGAANRLQITITPEWGHRTVAYVEPYTYKEINHTKITAQAYGSMAVNSWLTELCISGTLRNPYKCRKSEILTDTELNGLATQEIGAYTLETSRMVIFKTWAGATRRFGRYCAGAYAAWTYERYKDSMKRNTLNININFIF